MRSFDCVSVFTADLADARTRVVRRLVGAPRRCRTTTHARRRAHADRLARRRRRAAACFERVVQQLVDLGCAVETVDAAPMYDTGALMYGSALVAERFAAFGPFALAHPDAMDPAVLDIVRRTHAITGRRSS